MRRNFSTFFLREIELAGFLIASKFLLGLLAFGDKNFVGYLIGCNTPTRSSNSFTRAPCVHDFFPLAQTVRNVENSSAFRRSNHREKVLIIEP